MKWNDKTVREALKKYAGKYSATGFRRKMPGLVAWCDRMGGWNTWREEYGVEKRGWTEEKALAALTEHKDKNYTWFLENIASLVLWCRARGGWKKWASKVGIQPRKSYIKWTPERATALFKKYDNKPMQWFYDNYSSLIQWCNNNGGIIYWKKRVKKSDIVRTAKRIFNDETVLKILKTYTKYTAESIRGIDSSIVSWCEKHGGWESWIVRAGIKHKEKWIEKKVLAVLKENRDRSYGWFKFNYEGISGWCSAHGGWRKWAREAGVTTASETRTTDNVIAFFREHKDKELMWFIKKHPNLVRWCYRNFDPASEGLRHFAALGGIENIVRS